MKMEADRDSAANRVIRGGSWNNEARNVRAACRNGDEPGNRNNNVGFRCARAHERVGGSDSEQVRLRGASASGAGSPKWSAAGVLVTEMDVP